MPKSKQQEYEEILVKKVYVEVFNQQQRSEQSLRLRCRFPNRQQNEFILLAQMHASFLMKLPEIKIFQFFDETDGFARLAPVYSWCLKEQKDFIPFLISPNWCRFITGA